jgi:CheY-like chemotaxis protein
MPKLLLADDSVTIQRVIELTFSGEDIQVVAVGDGEEAIARILAEPPDIVLADIGMPKRSGYDVAAFVKGDPALAHIPVLLLAGAFEPVDQARAEQVKCDGVLVKPFEPQQVVARVRELVNGVKKSAPRVIDPRPIVEIPDARDAAESHAPGTDGGDSLDDYFDRLDAAFASLGNTGGAAEAEPPVLDEMAEPVDVPTIDDLLGAAAQPVPGDLPALPHQIARPVLEPPESMPTLSPAPQPPPAADIAHGNPPVREGGRNVIADVFSALLAVEQGDPDAARRLPGAQVAPAVTDALVDEVTRRVVERLAPDAARAVVARIVSEIAERLVREEIARIRGKM